MPRRFAASFGRARLVARVLGALVAASLALPAIALAQARAQEVEPQQAQQSPNEPSSAELVETPREYDGKRVEFVGEAIGEALERGGMAWLHLNDDAYHVRNIEEGARLGGYNSGMPVWIARPLAERIRFYGDYRHEGDVVVVRGVFNAACSEHGGDMDIHAEELSVLTEGHRVDDPVDRRKLLAVVVLLPVAGMAWWLDARLKTRRPGNGQKRPRR